MMGREVQNEQQQEEQCHFVTTYTIHRTAAVSLNTMNLDQMAINYSINHSIYYQVKTDGLALSSVFCQGFSSMSMLNILDWISQESIPVISPVGISVVVTVSPVPVHSMLMR